MLLHFYLYKREKFFNFVVIEFQYYHGITRRKNERAYFHFFFLWLDSNIIVESHEEETSAHVFISSFCDWSLVLSWKRR